jgi:hypothetical protein
VGSAVEEAGGIGTEYVGGTRGEEFVLELFEAKGGVVLSLFPEEGCRLAEDKGAGALSAGISNKLSDGRAQGLSETGGVGLTVYHESGKGLFCVEEEET